LGFDDLCWQMLKSHQADRDISVYTERLC
jgi:hypothetical protein